MQSANEELQSFQEELKSVNEELATVNAELGRKVDELGRVNSDLQNLFSSTDIAALFLDREQRITRFTPAARQLFRLIDADAGRPLSDFAPRFTGADLAASVGEVLRALTPVERQVEALDGQAWYLLRVLPYRTVEDVIGGTVVTLADITRIKRTEGERERLMGELHQAHDATTRLLAIGSLFLQEGNLSRILSEILDAAIAVSGADFGDVQLLDPASGDLVIAVQRGLPAFWVDFWSRTREGQGAGGTALARGSRVVVEDVEASPIFADAGARDVQRRAGVRAVQATPILGRTRAPLGMLSTHYRQPGRPSEVALRLLDLVARQAADILERAHIEEALRESEAQLRALTAASSEALFRMGPDWAEMREMLSPRFLARTEAPSATWLAQYIPPEDQAQVNAAIGEAIRSRSIFHLEHRVVRADGTVGWALSRAVPITGPNDEIVEWFGAASDITERRRASAALEKANARLREADQHKNEFLGILSHELRNPLSAIRSSIHVLDRSEPGESTRARRSA